MTVDDLQAAWTAHGALLERNAAISEALLRDSVHSKVRRTFAPYALARAVEVALLAALLIAIGFVASEHLTEPRYQLALALLAPLLLTIAGMTTHLLLASLQLDLARPVAAIQRDLERLRLAECRCTLWSLSTSVLAWLPVALLLFELVTGVTALAHVPLAFLVTNLALGLAALVVGVIVSRKLVDHRELSPFAERLVHTLSGQALRSARTHLDELARFERDES